MTIFPFYFNSTFYGFYFILSLNLEKLGISTDYSTNHETLTNCVFNMLELLKGE